MRTNTMPESVDLRGCRITCLMLPRVAELVSGDRWRESMLAAAVEAWWASGRPYGLTETVETLDGECYTLRALHGGVGVLELLGSTAIAA